MSPRRPAILAPGRTPLTYRELFEQVTRVTMALHNLDVGSGHRVAVVIPNGPENAVATVAVACGSACAPLDPDLTSAECSRYFRDLGIDALLTTAELDSGARTAARRLGIPIVDLITDDDPRAGTLGLTAVASITESVESVRDAFVLPTSGTTARPKVVPLTQANVCTSAINTSTWLRLGAEDRLLNVLPLFHAHGLFSGLMATLAAGASIVCTPGFDPSQFFDWMEEFDPTWITAVPSVHQAILAASRDRPDTAGGNSLRFIRSSSASLPATVLVELEEKFRVPVIETYGMTETTSQIASNPLPPGRRKVGSAGLAVGCEIRICDDDGHWVQPGRVGHIVVRGLNVTHGYEGDAELKSEAFDEGWFKTGDLGYLDDDGYLFIVGRTKDIINRGGQKVSPREIEEVLIEHPAIGEVVAFGYRHPSLGEDVAAAVVPRPGKRITARALRTFAARRLARFKIPRRIHVVAEIPRSRTGKISRLTLAELLEAGDRDRAAPGRKTFIPPETPVERELAGIWQTLLQCGPVGCDDDFFSLGGDSLLAVQMLGRVREKTGRDIPVQVLFEFPALGEFAASADGAERAEDWEPGSLSCARAQGGAAPLSYPQERLYVLNELDLTGYGYHVLDVVRLQGELNLKALESSLLDMVAHHDSLNTTFVERDGETVQLPGRSNPPTLELESIEPRSERASVRAIERVARVVLREPFDLSAGPLIRAKLLRLHESDHVLVVCLHHLVTDGWSQRLFWNELQERYNAHMNGQSPWVPSPGLQYRDFAIRQREWLDTPAAQGHLDYWVAQLQGVTDLPLPTDFPRPDVWSGRGARRAVSLSRTLTRKLKKTSHAHGCTLFMTLLSGFQCLLHRYTSHDDVAVGSLVANRNQAQLENVVGPFANTVVLRTDLSGDPLFSEVLSRVRGIALDALHHQEVPFERVVEALNPPRRLNRNALFHVMFVYQNARPTAPRLCALESVILPIDPKFARFDLVLELTECDGRLEGFLEYSTYLFEQATIDRMVRHLRRLLEGVARDPEVPISSLPMLSLRERGELLTRWQGKTSGQPDNRSLCRLFERQARRTPEATAVSQKGSRLSYRDLDMRSVRIAAGLVAAGVGPDSVVILCAERGIDFLVAMLAILRAGGAFLPLEPGLPVDRQAQILEKSLAPLVVSDKRSEKSVRRLLSSMTLDRPPKLVTLTELELDSTAEVGRSASMGQSDLAYVIFTSGSTGAPKGAMVEQRGMLNHLQAKVSDLGLTATDVIAQTAPQSFDICVWQFLCALLVGARVHVCDDDTVRDPALLMEEVSRERVTILEIVPSLMREVLECGRGNGHAGTLSSLRWMISTGEALTVELCRLWFQHYPAIPLMNAYGPTECSDDVTHYAMYAPPGPAAETVPIGYPIDNTRLYVLDAHLEPVPNGVTGELYVGGICVGRGYLNDRPQTERSFMVDPFTEDPVTPLYKTGDLVRRLPDGALEFLGRADLQVKIHGFRIELEEIEHALEAHPQVSEAVVLVRGDLPTGDSLIAYVVTDTGQSPLPDDLRDFLKRTLPAYMIPYGFVFLASMPLTPNGKVDRHSLQGSAERIEVTQAIRTPPRNASEELLASIWSSLLGVTEIGVSDNFFDLGGHSLLATRMLGRILDAFSVSLPLRAVFESPTIAGLAHRLDGASRNRPTEMAIAHDEHPSETPASITQEYVLAFERLLPGYPVFNLPYTFRYLGPLDDAALERSFVDSVRRHEALRTGFTYADESVNQVITPAGEVKQSLMSEDISEFTTEERERGVDAITQREVWSPFDLEQGPLIRLRLICLSPEDHVLIFIVHHIVMDGWSMAVWLEDLWKDYTAFVEARNPRRAELPIQFSDFARWQRRWCDGEGAAAQLDYWRKNLSGAVPVFPPGRDLLGIPRLQTGRETFRLEGDLVSHVAAFSQTQGSTLFMTLLAAFKAVLLITTGRHDLCVATVMANRSQPETERLIGPLENTVLIRTRMGGNASFKAAIRIVRDAVLEAHGRQELPFEVVARTLETEGVIDSQELVQAYFIYQNAMRRPYCPPELTPRPIGDEYRQGQSVMPVGRARVTLVLRETPTSIVGSCIYNESDVEPTLVRELLRNYTAFLANAVAAPETSLSSLSKAAFPTPVSVS
jgi:amino acid adenylation domain-containing protein